jgi:hypothetical protein
MVGLHTADRDQGVRLARDCVGHDVFQLAQLVAAESQSRVAVFSLGINFDITAKMGG